MTKGESTLQFKTLKMSLVPFARMLGPQHGGYKWIISENCFLSFTCVLLACFSKFYHGDCSLVLLLLLTSSSDVNWRLRDVMRGRSFPQRLCFPFCRLSEWSPFLFHRYLSTVTSSTWPHRWDLQVIRWRGCLSVVGKSKTIRQLFYILYANQLCPEWWQAVWCPWRECAYLLWHLCRRRIKKSGLLDQKKKTAIWFQT